MIVYGDTEICHSNVYAFSHKIYMCSCKGGLKIQLGKTVVMKAWAYIVSTNRKVKLYTDWKR